MWLESVEWSTELGCRPAESWPAGAIGLLLPAGSGRRSCSVLVEELPAQLGQLAECRGGPTGRLAAGHHQSSPSPAADESRLIRAGPSSIHPAGPFPGHTAGPAASSSDSPRGAGHLLRPEVTGTASLPAAPTAPQLRGAPAAARRTGSRAACRAERPSDGLQPGTLAARAGRLRPPLSGLRWRPADSRDEERTPLAAVPVRRDTPVMISRKRQQLLTRPVRRRRKQGDNERRGWTPETETGTK